VSPVKYELCFYIPEDGILHSHCRENLKSYMDLSGSGWAAMEVSRKPCHDSLRSVNLLSG
jgi:hypothetical protein